MIFQLKDKYKAFKAKKERRKRSKTLLSKKKKEVRHKPSYKEKWFEGMMFQFSRLLVVEKNKENSTNRYIFYIFVVLTVFLVGIVYPYARIREIRITINNQVLLDSQKIEEFFAQYHKESLLFFGDNLIAVALYSSFPEVQNFSCTRVFPHTIDCNIEEYKSAFILHKGEDETVEYIVNQAGRVISKRIKEEQSALLIVKTTNQELSIEVGEEIIEPWMIEYIFRSKNIYESRLGISILGIWWLERERELHLYTSRNFPIYLSFTQDLDSSLENLISVFGIRDFPALEYIDLRVPGKVFIKEL